MGFDEEVNEGYIFLGRSIRRDICGGLFEGENLMEFIMSGVNFLLGEVMSHNVFSEGYFNISGVNLGILDLIFDIFDLMGGFLSEECKVLSDEGIGDGHNFSKELGRGVIESDRVSKGFTHFLMAIDSV